MACELLGIGKINYDLFESDTGIETFVGGHVPNIVSDAQLIGLTTMLIARVGNDEAGNACIAGLKQRGVDTSHIVVDQYPTPSVKITLIGDDRKIGSITNAKLTEYTNGYLPLIRSAKAVFVDTKTLNIEDCLADCTAAKAFLVSSLQHLHDPYNKGFQKLEELPPNLLFANEEEASESKGIVDAVLSSGGTVVTTLGSAGCRIQDKRHTKTYKAFKANVVDATGAGDAFAAGYLFGVIRKFDEQQTAAIANAMGAIAVSQRGPVPLVTWKDVEEFLARNR